MVPKNPLRLIVSRTPIFFDLYNDGTEKFCATLDTLSCGHQQFAFRLIDDGKKRHRCAECAQAKVLALPTRKPSHSVRAERKKAGDLNRYSF